MKDIKVILFDAANTLIYKPQLFEKLVSVLNKYAYAVELDVLKRNHKILSEIINFPDVTSKSFYREFNTELLLSLGIIPNEAILDDIFSNCSYLVWKAFDDTEYLTKLSYEKAVISNFSVNLHKLLEELIGGDIFSEIIVSEVENLRKPSKEFFELAINKLQLHPNEILFIGDSLKLDIIPAASIGIRTLLLDREGYYPLIENRIQTIKEIEDHL